MFSFSKQLVRAVLIGFNEGLLEYENVMGSFTNTFTSIRMFIPLQW